MLRPPNKRMNPARSAPQTEGRGPCGLSACWAGLSGREGHGEKASQPAALGLL